MLKILNTTQTTTNREIDENGYLTVHNCLLLPSGIMEYLGAELLEGNDSSNSNIIDGITIDPDKIYKLNISDYELEKSLDSFKLIPIVNEHVFLGKDGKNPKDYQEGSVGENLEIRNIKDENKNIYRNYIVGTLKFTNPDTIKLIEEGIKEELSTSYTNDLKRSNNNSYDFEVINIVANHIALVEKGRAGSKVRVSNNNYIINNNNNKEEMTDNIINIEGKDVSLDEAIDIIRDKLNSQEEEVKSNNTEEDNNIISDNNTESYDDIINFLKSKLDSNSINILIDKLKRINSNDDNDNNLTDNNDLDEDKQDIESDNNKCLKNGEDDDNDEDNSNSSKLISQNSLEHIYNSIKSKLESEQRAIIRAYNHVKSSVGDFNFFGMNVKDIYRYALVNSNIPVNGKETLGELKAMFNVFNNSRSRIDNNYYSSESNFKLPNYLK